MTCYTANKLIGHESFTDFLDKFNDDHLTKLINTVDRISQCSYISTYTLLKIKSNNYIFFNSSSNFLSNEPISDEDELILEDEEYFAPLFKKLEKKILEKKIHDFSTKEIYNKYFKLNKLTTILLDEKDGKFFTVEKNYKYRLVITYDRGIYLSRLPKFDIIKTDQNNFRLFSLDLIYSPIIKEYYPEIKGNLEYCEYNNVINHELFKYILEYGVPLNYSTIYINMEHIKNKMHLYEKQYKESYQKYLELKSNNKSFCFLEINKHIYKEDRNIKLFEKYYKNNKIVISILKSLNNHFEKQEYFIQIIPYHQKSYEILESIKKQYQKKCHVNKIISEEEALKNAQKLIEEEEKEKDKRKKKKSKKQKPIEINKNPESIDSNRDGIEGDKDENELIKNTSDSFDHTQLPVFFGNIESELLCELNVSIESLESSSFSENWDDSEQFEGSALLDEFENSDLLYDVESTEQLEEKIFNNFENSYINPMIDTLLDQSEDDLPRNNSYCQFGSEEHYRRMREWNLSKIIPEIYCMPEKYLISMFSQMKAGW